MTNTNRLAQLATITLLTLAGSQAARAETPELSPAPATTALDPRFHLDVEIDPTAYALEGYSLHVGLGWNKLRVDLGAFAMAVPSAVQTNDAFDVSINGFGAKLQYFPLAEQRRGFIGVDMNLCRQLVERAGTMMASRDLQVGVGVNAGWRFQIGRHIYATPWLGVSYASKTRDVTLAGSTYETNRITVFPAVHVGYRFR